MTRIAGLLFDFDGTLAELHIDFEAMRRQVAELAAVFMDQAPEPSTAPVLEWIDQLAARMSLDLPGDDVLEFCSRCRMRLVGLEMRAAARGRLFPFTPGVLAGLQDKGVRTAVVTRNCTPAVTTVYPQIMQEVDCLLAREDVQRVKPDPDHLFRAIRILGVRPEECCMVGDHWLDIQAAHRAGIRSAAVHTGRISAKELARYGPDFSAPDVHSLVRELSRFGLLQADCRDRIC